ncbi:MAG TPA: site-2 protease family protein [Candidatus Baltobacteraceae bacterium]|nr:site-2 protease family protein [Candidatus Baltobacteraceae bacterium]
MAMRENLPHMEEIKNILIADAVLIVAFSSTIAGGLFSLGSRSNFFGTFVSFLPIAAMAVTLSFVLHELMHKFVAQHYGAAAAFKTSLNGLVITLLTGAFGFLVGIPGATWIFTNSFTKRQNGIVSLAGPLTNFAVFGVFAALLFFINPPPQSYLHTALQFTLFISILLAFFNMLPIFPLDGSKVLAWSKPIYLVTMAVIFILIMALHVIPLSYIVIMFIIALLFSTFYRFAL